MEVRLSGDNLVFEFSEFVGLAEHDHELGELARDRRERRMSARARDRPILGNTTRKTVGFVVESLMSIKSAPRIWSRVGVVRAGR